MVNGNNACFYECKDLVEEFLNGKDISYFKKFSFDKLWENKENYKSKYRIYNSYDKNGVPHADSSRLARLIYYLLWGNHKFVEKKWQAPNLNDADNSFSAGNNTYGGDTLITNIGFSGDKTIGNFMILPKGKADNKKTTLNMHRNSCFNDDFYKFMETVDKMYKGEVEKEDIWVQLYENNKWYFGKIGNFDNFVKIYMLEGWETLKNGDKNAVEEFIKRRNEKICKRLSEIFNSAV